MRKVALPLRGLAPDPTRAQARKRANNRRVLAAAWEQLERADTDLALVADPAVRAVLDRLHTAVALLHVGLARHQRQAHPYPAQTPIEFRADDDERQEA